MTHARPTLKHLAGALALCAAATGALSLGSAASAAPAPAGATTMTSDQQPEAGKCRWVKTRGLICETELSTVNI